MPTFIIHEDNQSLKGKNFKVPKEILKTLQNNVNLIDKLYQNNNVDSYKKLLGYKRNQKLLNNKKNIVNYGELKRWKYDLDHTPNKNDNNLSYQLNGGNEAINFVNNTLNQARNSVKQVNQVKKSANISKSNLKPKKNPTKPISTENGSKITLK